jgi:hypothetical protein
MLVTEESVEFEKLPVEVPDFRKIISHFRGISDIHLKEMKKIPTCDQVDLEKSESYRLSYAQIGLSPEYEVRGGIIGSRKR